MRKFCYLFKSLIYRGDIGSDGIVNPYGYHVIDKDDGVRFMTVQFIDSIHAEGILIDDHKRILKDKILFFRDGKGRRKDI